MQEQTLKTIHVVAAIIFRNTPLQNAASSQRISQSQVAYSQVIQEEVAQSRQVLATQRGYGEFKGGWEFPGGKIEKGESPEEALKREIKEELAAEIQVKNLLHTIEYDYPTFHLSMKCYVCELLAQKEITLLEHEEAKWLNKTNLYSVDWLPADVEVLDKILPLL